MKIDILGVSIDDLSEGEILNRVARDLGENKRIFIATPNPEMLVFSERDAEFKNILNAADIKIPDGAGLKFGAKILGRELKNRVTGTDLMEQLCGLAAERNLGVYFLGGWNNAARMAAENLKKKFPDLKICGAEGNGKMDEWNTRIITEHINAVRPDFLFVALGHGKQEKWIFENLEKFPGVKLAMGVGGAFDFFAGRIKRAPRWMREAGLEWLWRLLKEPKRYKRILTATIVFPWLCLTYARLNFCAAPRRGAKKQ